MPKAEGAAVLGTLRTGARARTITTEGPIAVEIKGLLPNRVEPIRRGVSSMTEHLKRRAESWPNG